MNRVRVLENAGFLGFLGISRQKNYTNKIKKGSKIVFLQLLQFRRSHSKSIFFVCKTTLIEGGRLIQGRYIQVPLYFKMIENSH